MAYDIPPPLQHKEKILFGLTFQQLGYAAPAFLLLVFLVLKIKMSIYVSGTIGILIALVAVFFMFFEGLAKIRHWTSYFRNSDLEVLSSELKNIVDIVKIENDTVQKRQQRLAILEVIPMNFMLKTKEEKEGIIIGFQKFLNSLDFSVQIHITSTPISLREHLQFTHHKVKQKIVEIEKDKSVEEEKRKEHAQKIETLFESYCMFIKKKIEDNQILNRKFYVIIEEKDDVELQKEVCKERLQSLGLRVRQLNDEEIGSYFHEYIALKKEKNVDREVTDVGHFLYAPEKVIFCPDHFIVHDLFCKVIAVTGYPHSVEEGFLDKIISSGEQYDISIHIEPFPIEDTMIQLNRELQKQQSDLFSDAKKGILNPSLDIKFASTRKVLENLQKGKQKLFNVSLYIMCKEQSKKEKSTEKKEITLREMFSIPHIRQFSRETFRDILRFIKRQKDVRTTLSPFDKVTLLAKKVKANLDAQMIQSTVPNFQMMDAYASMLPLANNRLGIKRNIHSEGLAAFFPFSSPFLDVEPDGILLGLNKNKIPYIKNVFHLANANGIILATSGAGKSYFTKLLLSRQFLNGCDIIIIDPQGEYAAITKEYMGQCIILSKDSDTIINPLDLMGHSYIEKRLQLMDLFHIMFPDLNELQKAILDRAVDLTYEENEIDRDSTDGETPTMGELYTTLEKLEKHAVPQEKVTYRALMNRLQMYTEKGVFGFLDTQTKINFDNRFVCFNMGDMPKQVKPVMMYLVLDYVYMKMKDNKRRKLLVIDEAWSMLQTAEESSYIFEIVKTCRKYNLGLLMITQDVADLVDSKAGHAVLANTSYTFLLRQKPAVITNVARTFNLSQPEKEFLMSASLGNGILILENEHQEIEVIASSEEHKLITTNPDELTQQKKKDCEPKKQKTVVDLFSPVVAKQGLSIHQQNMLNNHGYYLKKFHNLERGPLAYYVKPQGPESIDHTFLVHIIYEEIKKHTEQVWTYQTRKPDIIFVNKEGRKIALEIETGINMKQHKERMNEKFENVKKTYKDRAWIVLTDNDLMNSYAKYGLPMLLRTEMKSFISEQIQTGQNDKK